MEFGGPFFPFANFWSAVDEERNINAGAWLRHAVSPRVRFDLGYDFTDSRGRNRYDAASLAAISVVYARILDQAAIGDRFPDNFFPRHALTTNLDPPLDRKSVVEGQSVACRVSRGGRRIMKTKKITRS